jgi:hypothetical protein
VGHRLGRILVLALTLVWRLAAAEQERGDIELTSIDARNAAKGGGAVLSNFAQFGDNPSFGAIEEKFSVGSTYYFMESFSFVACDNKTAGFGGGLLYDRHNRLDTIKTNTAFKIGEWFYAGFNLKFLSGQFYPVQRKVQAFTADIGLGFKIADIVFIGASLNDFVPLGDNLPMRVMGQFEVDIYKRMFLFNFAGGYHIDHKEEKVPNRRPFAAYADFSTGLEFRYSWFSAQVGVSSSSFARDFTFDDLLKTVGIGFYKERTVKVKPTLQTAQDGQGAQKQESEGVEDGGGAYVGLYITRTFITFAVTFIWEPK